jgi:hypothetical protein
VRTLALLLCLAACDAGAKPEPTPAPAPARPSVPAKPPATAGADLTYLPADSDVLLHIDVAALRRSKLWTTYTRDVANLVAPGFAACDYDPLSQVATVDIGVPIATKLNVSVFRGLDRDKALACFRGLKADSNQTATFDGDFVTLTSKTGAIHVLTFVDAHTMVMQGSTQPTKQTLQQALQLGADAPLRKNASFVAALNKTKRSAAMTIVSRPGSEAMAAQMKAAGLQLSYFYGSLDLTDQLVVQYAMVVASASQATQMATMMRSQVQSPQVKQMFDRLEARAQDDTVTLDVAMSEPKLASLAGMVRGMIPQQ